MRILLTTDTIGGVWTFSRVLSEQLLKRGHTVALVSFGRATSEVQRSWLQQTTLRHGMSFQFFESEAPLEWMQENGTAFEDGAEVLLHATRDFHADVLHSGQFCWGALPCQIPKLITVHSDVMSWAAACKPDALHESSWLLHYRKLVQRGLLGANVAVAPTAWMRDALRANFETPSHFEVIHNGRSIAYEENDSPRCLQAVSVGRMWDEAKGLSTLLETSAPLPLLIAGEESFEQTQAATGSAMLISLGVLSESELFELFHRSAIYIAPSIYEPFGLAPLEAALGGCAVVARDISSFREVWGDAALYFQTTGDLEQLLHVLVQEPSKLREVQYACRQRASQFTAPRMASQYLSLYEGLLRSSLQHVQLTVPQEFAADAA
jgi:glycosyltransferase involved in cell wall biosynthesis